MKSVSDNTDGAKEVRVSIAWDLLASFCEEGDGCFIFFVFQRLESLAHNHVVRGWVVKFLKLTRFQVVFQTLVILITYKVSISSIDKY